VRLFSLSILTDKIVLVVQSCKVPSPLFPGMVIPVCQITNGGCGRKTLIVMSVDFRFGLLMADFSNARGSNTSVTHCD
jgi:hypothetical protein